MDTSLPPFGQVLRKLCMLKPPQLWEPLPNHYSSKAMSRDSIPLKLSYIQATPPIEVFLSIPESSHHELHIAHVLTFMNPSLCGWEAFPTPGALTHTRITWALSPTAPQVPHVILGSSLCPWCFWHSMWRGAQHSPCPKTSL